MSDKEKVHLFISQFGSITQRQASELLRCDRLSARVYELRKSGINIVTERVPFHKDGHWSTYARYWIKEERDAG